MPTDHTTTLLSSAGLDDRWAETLDRLRAFVAARVDAVSYTHLTLPTIYSV